MNNDELIVTCALRYAIGRRTYIVGEVTNYITKRLESLSTSTLKIMCDDIKFALHINNVGDACDKELWATLKDDITNELVKRDLNSSGG